MNQGGTGMSIDMNPFDGLISIEEKGRSYRLGRSKGLYQHVR